MASRRRRWTSFVDIMDALNVAQGLEKGSNLGLAQAIDIPYSNAGVMRHRKVIPAKYWPNLLRACERFKVPVASDDLVRLLSRTEKKRCMPATQRARTARSAVPRRVSTVRSSTG